MVELAWENLLYSYVVEEGDVFSFSKRNLIPFAETNKTESGNEHRGTFLAEGIVVSPMICYETVFLRNFLESIDSDLIITISNDSFADGTVLGMMHKAYTIQNAKITNKNLLFVCASGESFFISSNGKVIDLADLHTRKTDTTIIEIK